MTGQHFLLPQSFQAHRSRTPGVGPGGFESFDVRAYWRRASCAEVGCEAHEKGWTTALNEAVQQQATAAQYIRSQSGRRFTESRTEAGWTQFDFPAGQTCFQAGTHKLPADRQELYLRQGGDWRQRTGPARSYERPDQWADDFHARTDEVATARSRAGTADP